MEDNKNKKVLNVPTLRFPEFSGEWKLTNLNNLYFSYNSLSGKNKIDFENGNSKYVTYLNVFENVKIEKIFSRVRVSNDELQNSILNNDMFVTLSSETPEEVAISSCLDFKIDENIYLNSFCFGLRPKVEVNSLFTAYMIRSPKLRKRIFPLAQGSTRFNLNKEHFLEKLKIYICNKKEQSKIANFLSLIDKRIELQNKIIRDYKLLKKGIQNCFFKNINSDNSYSLSCFLEEYTLKNLKNNLQVVSVGKYGIRQRNEIYSKVLSDDLSKNKVIFQDTLTIGMGTKQIDFGILSKNVEYCVSPAYRTYKIKNINSEYLKYYLEIINNQLSRKYMIISARQGTTIDNKSFLKHQLVVHPILKQNYIVNVINIIQKYLTISDDILETHKDLKKYLLKHIFI